MISFLGFSFFLLFFFGFEIARGMGFCGWSLSQGAMMDLFFDGHGRRDEYGLSFSRTRVI